MDMMQAILTIEEKVKHMTESTELLRPEYEENLRCEIEARESEIEQKISAQVEQAKLRMEAEQSEALEKLEKQYEKKLELLSNTYKTSKQAWVNEIMQHIISH